ncbi:alpha-L-rhamnosidase [Croceicoccus sp. Ery5]|uniref:alpha-L-rhamnosidase n=1 Tax=Croceicoccus sp. Ery5 TaxID=1703340 RepID=UPI001E48403F|nr:alpha-L-rhamnosidase [Croceicoccus sp. Ery5]
MLIIDLRAENIVEPLGMQERHPRLSWRMENARAGSMQRSYRIRAATNAQALSGGPLLWDSGTVETAQSFDIRYDGPPLQGGQRIWWQVEVTDDAGETAVSEASRFEGGPMGPADWQAGWIVAEDEEAAADRAAGVPWVWSETALDPRPNAFRIDFDAPADMTACEIMVSGKDHLRGVWINGEPCQPEWPIGWDSHLPFWGVLGRYSGAIKPGKNRIHALVEADTEGFFPVDGGAFAALIRIRHADGSVERLTGDQWQVLPDPPQDWRDADGETAGWLDVVPSTSWAQNYPRPSEPAMMLRREFTPRAPVVSARLYATALGAYHATINGKPVSDACLAPEITVASDHVLTQAYDVTGLIENGANAIGALVGDGWYASPFGWRIERYGFGPPPRRFSAMLRLDYSDGGSEIVATGEGWKSAVSSILKSEIYDGETRDARLEQPGWDCAGFDDSQWADAPLGDVPDTRLVAQTAPALKHMRSLRPLSISEPVEGRYVLDFGQNFSGWVRIEVAGPRGTEIALRFAELLNDDGTADQSNLRLAWATDRFILAGEGVESFEPRFTYHGFRYVEIEGWPGVLDPDAVEGIVVHSACRETGEVQFPDAPLLQSIWNNALWSQRSNFFAVPTDCPQRDERMGWMGDIQVFLDAAAFNMEVDPFIRRFLLEARAAQRDDGAYPIVVPQPQSFPDVATAGWSEAGIILPWQLWQRYGDTAVIDENWDAMVRWMDHLERHNPDLVWRNERGLDLGDWLSVDAIQPDDETTPRVLCATAYWAWSAQLLAEMARATGRDGDAARFAALREAIGARYAAEFVADDGTCGNGSQTGQVLSLAFDLVPEKRRDKAAALLAADIRARGMTLSTGFLGTPYLLDVLADAGLMEEVSCLLLQTAYPSWGYMPQQGATTVWERWNGDTGDLAMNSYNHYAFGAVVGFFYRRLAGIAPAAPGFARIAVRPVWLPEVGRVSARYDSVMGRIEAATDGDGEGLKSLSLAIPPNTSAQVELPAGEWQVDGIALSGHAAVSSLSIADGHVRFDLANGAYRFQR